MRKITPRFFAIAGLLLLILLSGWFLHRSRSQKELAFPTANVLLITIDTIRPDYLSCYGGSNQTPQIDALAERGILFENAYSQVPLTFPSHTSILTGHFPVRHGMHQNGIEVFSDSQDLITGLYKQNGFATGAAVSSFVLDRKFGLAEGFDLYDDKMERLPTITTNFEVERRADETLSAAIKFLDLKSAEDRWFLWIHFYDPHTPYNPPAGEGYGGEIVFVDQQIGRLMDYLSQKKLDENLIVALLGDHGESLGEHGEKTHGFFAYNSTLKIPLILSYPEAKQQRISYPVAAVDIAPTLLELSGIPDTRNRDGRSLLKTAHTKSREGDIYFESRYAELLGWNGLQGLIRGNWKLISTTRSELYDVTKDPDEKQNLYSAKPDVSGSLKNDLLQLRETETVTDAPDPEVTEKLKSLGYIGATTMQKKDRSADPKDKIALWSRYEESLEAIQTNQKDKIEGLLLSLVQQEPTNNFFRIALAGQYRQTNHLQPAVEQLQHAIQNDPTDAMAYHALAVTFKEMKNYEEALRAAEAAIALQPDRSEFHSIRGMIWVETAQFQKAKVQFLQVIQMDPNNAIAWNNLGNAHRALNELDEATRAYKTAIELSPHYAYPQNGLATILVKQNRPRDAIPYFEKAIELDPKFVEVYFNMGIAFHSLKEPDRAKTLYLTFLKLAPDWMDQQKQNARILLSQLQ